MIRAILLVLLVAELPATACYPKACDPAKDPLQCQCPPGACGDYPPEPTPERHARDAAADG